MADIKKEPVKKHYANIAGVEIDLDHESVKKASSAADIAKLGIFNHLKDDEKKVAEQELYEAAHAKAAPVEKEKDKT